MTLSFRAPRSSNSRKIGRIILIGFIFAAVGCARAVAPAGPGPKVQSVRVNFKVNAAQTFGGLGIAVAPDGMAIGAVPNAVADVSSGAGSACQAGAGGARTCTAIVRAPVGLDDFVFTIYDRAPVKDRVVGRVVASGAVLRQSVGSARAASFGVTVGGSVAGFTISPAVLAAPADGKPHQVPFAVIPTDADGFYILNGTPPLPHLTTTGDPQGLTSVAAQGGDPTAYALSYDGAPLVDVKLVAGARSLHGASADFTPLVVSPSSLALASSGAAASPLRRRWRPDRSARSRAAGRAPCRPRARRRRRRGRP